MNFLGVGPMELIIVAALAYFLLGPKKMGEAGKSVGKILRELREQRDEFTSMLMESVDLEDKPKSSTPARPATPVGAVPQSGDPGGSSESKDPSDSGGSSEEPDAAAGAERSDGASTRADDDGGGQDRAATSDSGSKQEEDK